MRTSSLVVLAAFAALGARACAAADFDIAAGGSVTAHHVWTDAEFLDLAFDAHDVGDWRWSPVATLGHIGSVHGLHHRDHFDRQVWITGAGARLSGFWGRMFASAQLGAASARDDALSSTAQFITTLGWQGERFVFYVRHVSNGDLFGGKNLGETMLMAGVRFD